MNRIEADITIYMADGTIHITPKDMEFLVPVVRPRHITLVNSVNRMLKEIINQVRSHDSLKEKDDNG